MDTKSLVPQQVEPIIGLLLSLAWKADEPLSEGARRNLLAAFDSLEFTTVYDPPREVLIQLALNLANEYEMTRLIELLEQLVPQDPCSPAIAEGEA